MTDAPSHNSDRDDTRVKSSRVLSYEGPRGSGAASWTVRLLRAGAVLASFVVLMLIWRARYGDMTGTVPRRTDLVTTVQVLRSQVVLFRIQHNDRLPGACPLVDAGGPAGANEATFWAQMTQFSDIDAHVNPTKTARFCYGPYLGSVPANRLNGSRTIASAPAPGVGFVYDFAGGAGSGKVWGVDELGVLVQQ